MTDRTRLQELLTCFPFLADLPVDLLARLAERAELLRFNQGQPICRPDHALGHVYFLLEGTARSVVFSQRLPRGVTTLQRLHPGGVMGWTLLSCGRCCESLIASTDLVVVAVPQEVLRQEMDASPLLSQRVHASVSPSELFGVLDAHLKDYPRALSTELVEAAERLAGACMVRTLSGASSAEAGLPQDRIWLVSAGPLPLGTSLHPEQPIEADEPLRVLGLDPVALATILEPPEPTAASSDGPSGNGWHGRLLDHWQQERQALDPQKLRQGISFLPQEPEEVGDPAHMPAEAFPWVQGVGPLESPIAAFRMLSQHLGLPFRRELLRRVFGDQVQRHGEASLALAGAVAESIGLQTQLLEIRAEALPRLAPPLLLRWGNGLAVIYRCDKRHVVAGIPAVGNQELSLADFAEQWGECGEVLTLRVNELTPRRKFGFRWFLPALRQHRTVLLEVLVASFFVQLFGLVNPLLIQQVIDKVIINNSPGALGVLGLLLLVFSVFEGLLLCLRTFLFADTTNRIDLALGTQIIDHLDYPAHSAKPRRSA